MRPRSAGWLAWNMWLIGLLAGSAGVLIASLYMDQPLLGGLTSFIQILFFSSAGALVASRRPNNPIGWILSAMGLLLGLNIFGGAYGEYALLQYPAPWPLGAEMDWFAEWSWIPVVGLLVTFVLLLFPNGWLPSQRWRWVGWAAAITIVVMVVVVVVVSWPERGLTLLCASNQLTPEQKARVCPATTPVVVEGPVDQLVLGGFAVLGIVAVASITSLFIRFRRSEGVERQQLKWFAFGSTIALTGVITGFIPLPFLQTPLFFDLSLLAVPTAIAVAILRFRLYDIDFIIRRTLIYTLLTAVLALIYLGGVVVLQQLFRALTGQGDQLAIVASTLAIAALFQPVRRRIQTAIDRRFYRRRYNIQRTLQAFSSTLRDDVDLNTLTDSLVGVVDETLRPAHVSLWLRQPNPVRSRSQQQPEA